MIRSHPLRELRRFVLPLSMWAVTVLVLLTTVLLWSAQNPAPPNNGKVQSPPVAMSNQAAMNAPKDREEPTKSNLEMTRSDAAELSALAEQLRDELNKTNVNVLSLDIIEKTKKVEKLAKKIKGEAHGYGS